MISKGLLASVWILIFGFDTLLYIVSNRSQRFKIVNSRHNALQNYNEAVAGLFTNLSNCETKNFVTSLFF